MCAYKNTRERLLVLLNCSRMIIESVVIIFLLNLLLLQKRNGKKLSHTNLSVGGWRVMRPCWPRVQDLEPSVCSRCVFLNLIREKK